MKSLVRVLEPAEDISLVTLYEAKAGLNILQSSTTNDDTLEMLIEMASAEAAVLCDRTFAYEKVEETFYEIGTGLADARLWLSHWPVKRNDIIKVEAAGGLVHPSGYRVDEKNGALTGLDGNGWTQYWAGPVTVTYGGGYKLPFEAPPALKKAVMLMAREEYVAATSGSASAAGIRMVAHKEKRVMYHPASAATSSGGSTTSAARTAADRLLRLFRRTTI